MSTIAEFLRDAAELRRRNTARYLADQPPGHCQFNTHHGHYQAVLETGRFVVLERELAEMSDAAFERWVEAARALRALARRG